ncbi:28.1 kDa virulence protein [Enterobacter sp. DC4]|uniref:Tc toxin subunit A n=1 Tax=Enterobacter sp. DC4 TaxID=1395580 RepID=UPI0003ECE4AC|nr:Tc toxin subunit A [Enterobacter sp. DC4]EWG65843.1 28.1 kDa virulence protein [Enterobacter sp. DC4]
MSQPVTEPVTVSPLITRTEDIHNVSGQLSALGYASVFDVVRMPRERFIQQHNRALKFKAAEVYDLAIGYAHQVAHSFRHNRLARAVKGGLKGPFSVSGPDYRHQFSDENWSGLSPAGAPEANDGPAHYAAVLYRLALDREKDAGTGGSTINLLATRRPDLAALTVDDKAINEEIPQLQVVTGVLSSAIRAAKSLTSLADVNALLATTRYPNSLPFDLGNAQMQAVQQEINTTLQDLTLPLAADVPAAFLSPTTALTNDDLARLQVMASGLGPEQQRILLDRFTEDWADFYLKNYAISGGGDDTYTRFLDMSYFTTMNDMTVPQVEALLCTTASNTGDTDQHSVIQSTNWTNPDDAPKALPFLYGASFVNNPNDNITTPLTIKRGADKSLTLGNLPDGWGLTAINIMVRLQKWLNLPFEDVDALLLLTRTGSSGTPLTENTLRTLGVFRHFQRQYGTTVKQFVAWVSVITPYAITPTTPFLDQIFNGSKAFDTPLQVDNTPFVYRAEATGSDATAELRCKHIMAALGLNQRQFLLLADKIAANQGGDVTTSTLTCNLPTVTAFYRIATLAGTLGMTVEAFYALVDTWDTGTGDVWKQFAGNPVITPPASGVPLSQDILSLLQALSWVTDWQQQAKLPMATCALLSNPPATAGTDAQLSFIQQIWQRLPATFVDTALLARSGAPLQNDTEGHFETIDWFSVFRTGDGAGLLDVSGLVTDLSVTDTVKKAVNAQVNLSKDSQSLAITALTATLQQAQATQSGVAITALAQALNVSQSLPALLLRWAQTTPYQWLSRTWNLSPVALVGELPLVSEGRFGATTTEQDYNLLAADWRDLQWAPDTGNLTFTARLSFSIKDNGQYMATSSNWLPLPTGLSVSGAPTLSSDNWPTWCSPNANYDGTNAVYEPVGNAVPGDGRYTPNAVYTLDVPLKGTFTDINALAALPLQFGMHCFSSISGNLNTTWTLKATVTTADTIPADWLATLRDIVRRGMACTRLQLSPAGLQHWLDYPAWFSLDADEQKGAISIQTLYRLSRYHDLLTLAGSAGYTEDDLLAYLRDVNATPPLAPADAATRLADLLGWEATEIAAAFVTGGLGHTAASLDDLDVVMCLQQGELASGLTVAQLAEGFSLKQTGDTGEYTAWSRMGQAMVAGARHLAGLQ